MLRNVTGQLGTHFNCQMYSNCYLPQLATSHLPDQTKVAFAGSSAAAPFSLVEALHRSSLSEDAVDLLQRSAASTPGSDAEACTVLDIHLACRSPSQAFLQVLLLGLGPRAVCRGEFGLCAEATQTCYGRELGFCMLCRSW